jgi:hypothetical protein
VGRTEPVATIETTTALIITTLGKTIQLNENKLYLGMQTITTATPIAGSGGIVGDVPTIISTDKTEQTRPIIIRAKETSGESTTTPEPTPYTKDAVLLPPDNSVIGSGKQFKLFFCKITNTTQIHRTRMLPKKRYTQLTEQSHKFQQIDQVL